MGGGGELKIARQIERKIAVMVVQAYEFGHLEYGHPYILDNQDKH